MQYQRNKASTFLSLVWQVKIGMSLFLLLMLLVSEGQKIESSSKSHREKFFRGRASSSSHLGEQESQELHSSHLWALARGYLVSTHQHFEFPCLGSWGCALWRMRLTVHVVHFVT